MASPTDHIGPVSVPGSHFNIHTLNVNGLNKKINKVVDFLIRNKIDILLVQETHVIAEKKN